jgi:hypothetical protein
MSKLFEFMDIAISEYKLKKGETPNPNKMVFNLTPKMMANLADEVWEQSYAAGKVKNVGKITKASYKGIEIIEIPWKRDGHPTLECKE